MRRLRAVEVIEGFDCVVLNEFLGNEDDLDFFQPVTEKNAVDVAVFDVLENAVR